MDTAMRALQRRALVALLQLKPGDLRAALGTTHQRVSILLRGRGRLTEDERRALARLVAGRVEKVFTQEERA